MLLTIGMMVKNEAKHLEDCLISLEPIRKELDSELIIVDTGSDDNTVDIAKRFTDKVYFHEWNDNFSEMRNTVISYAKGQWYFSHDGDEIIANPEGFIDFFKSGKYKKYNTALVTQKNYTNLKENRFSKILVPRLFKNDEDFHFEGAVHNQPQYKKPIYQLDTILDHYGYIASDKDLIERKFKRTATILKQELEKDPDNVYYWFQLSKSYNMHNDYEDALESIEEAYRVAKKNNIDLSIRMYIYIQLAKMNLLTNRYKKAEEIALKALGIKDGYVDLYYYLARAQLLQNKKKEALNSFKKYIDLINNYDSTNSKKDTSVDDETMGNGSIAYRFIVALAADLETDNEYAIKAAFAIDNKTQLAHVIKPYITICLKDKQYNLLIEFYNNKMQTDKLQNTFINTLEQKRLNLDEESNFEIAKVFAENDEDNNYFLLNQVRVAIYSDKEVVDIEEIFKLDYNQLADYYGDIIYFLLSKIQNEEYNLLTTIKEENLNRYMKYLHNKHGDLSKLLISFIENSREVNELSNIRIKKILSRYVLAFVDEINETNKKLIPTYLNYGIKYMKKLYREDVLEEELINEVKNEEEAFLIYIYKAEKNKQNDAKIYINYLRKALNVYPLMKNVIEFLLMKIQNRQEKSNKKMEELQKGLKDKIEKLVNIGIFDEAEKLITQYENIIGEDTDIQSIKSVMYIIKDELKKAKEEILNGLSIDDKNFDLNFNLGYVFEQMGNYQEAVNQYMIAKSFTSDQKEYSDIEEALNRIKTKETNIKIDKKKKIVIFIKKGLDKFIDDLIEGLSDDYIIKKIIVTKYKKIDKWMEWADIVWFEWCDELVIYGSKQEIAKEKDIICRLHRYEVFRNFPQEVQWRNINKLIIVTEHLKQLIKLTVPDIENEVEIEVIQNGVNINKYKFKSRKKGYNIAYVGLIHRRKDPIMLLQIIKKLVQNNKNYKLYVAGKFEDVLLELYWKYMVVELELGNNVFFDGWQDDISKWLEDKNYLLSTSIHESFGYAIAEGMTRGLKPIIHNFIYSKEIWLQKYLFNTVDEAIEMIESKDFNSKEYRDFIVNNYSLRKQITETKRCINKLILNKKDKIKNQQKK